MFANFLSKKDIGYSPSARIIKELLCSARASTASRSRHTNVVPQSVLLQERSFCVFVRYRNAGVINDIWRKRSDSMRLTWIHQHITRRDFQVFSDVDDELLQVLVPGTFEWIRASAPWHNFFCLLSFFSVTRIIRSPSRNSCHNMSF